jgi:hypothetical protein
VSASRSERRLLWALFALLAGLYLLSTGGHTYASDEEAMYEMAANLIDHGSYARNAGSGEAPVYYQYGPGQPTAAVPLLLLARAVAAAFPPEGFAYVTRAVMSWFNPFVTAAVAVLLAVAALRLGYGRGAAAAVALLFGLATFAWPHSKTFFSEPLSAGLSFAGFALAIGAGAGPRRQALGISAALAPPAQLALAGMLAGLAALVKIHAGLYLPLVGLWVLWQGGRGGRGERWSLPGAVAGAAVWSAGALVSLALLGLFQRVAYGSPFQQGYGDARLVFTYPLAEGLYGLLFSSGKSLFLYAPPLLLLLPALWLLARRDVATALLCGAATAATLAVYGRFFIWHGDGSWGPRYLYSGLPFMVFPLVAVCAAAGASRGWRAALIATLLLAAPVQLGGLAINLNAYLGVQRDADRRYFDPSQSPIVGHLRLAAAQLAQSYALRLAPNTVALAGGFSYSEGDRAAGAQLPRWTLPEARVELRPPANAGPLRVDLALGGCLPAALPPAEAALALDGRPIWSGAACPPRRYALLLPPRRATLTLATGGWRPAALGIDREGALGLYVTGLAARAGGEPLAVAGRLVPIPPAPPQPGQLRQWASDYRYGHWDLWPWYLAHSGMPAGPAWALAIVWAALGLGLLLAGALGLRQALAGSSAPDARKRRTEGAGRQTGAV